MSIDPRVTDNRPGTSPDRGMNARSFVIIVAVAVLVLITGIGIFFATGRAGSASPEQRQSPSSTTSPAHGSSDTGHSSPQ